MQFKQKWKVEVVAKERNGEGQSISLDEHDRYVNSANADAYSRIRSIKRIKVVGSNNDGNAPPEIGQEHSRGWSESKSSRLCRRDEDLSMTGSDEKVLLERIYLEKGYSPIAKEQGVGAPNTARFVPFKLKS